MFARCRNQFIVDEVVFIIFKGMIILCSCLEVAWGYCNFWLGTAARQGAAVMDAILEITNDKNSHRRQVVTVAKDQRWFWYKVVSKLWFKSNYNIIQFAAWKTFLNEILELKCLWDAPGRDIRTFQYLKFVNFFQVK